MNKYGNEVICLNSSDDENDIANEEVPVDTNLTFRSLLEFIKTEDDDDDDDDDDDVSHSNLEKQKEMKRRGRKSQIYTCNLCKKELVGKLMYHYHLKNNHRDTTKSVKARGAQKRDTTIRVKGRGVQKRTFECYLCKKQIKGKVQLKIHMKNAHGTNFNPQVDGSDSKCPVCNIAIRRNMLDVHLNRIHQTSLDLLSPFHCAKCDRLFHRYGNLLHHVKVVHEGFNSNIAPNPNQQNLDVDENEIPNREVGFTCSKSARTFPHSNCLLKHEFKCHNPKTTAFKCKYCPVVFTQYKNAKRHEKKYHLPRSDESPKKYLVRKCKVQNTSETEIFKSSNQSVEQSRDLMSKVTPGGVKIVYADELCCSFCPKFLSSVQSKQRHERIHTGDNPYQCKYCEASYRLPDTHRDHQNKCLSLINTFWCPMCDFNNKSQLVVEKHCLACHKIGFDFTQNEFIAKNIRPDNNVIPPDHAAYVMRDAGAGINEVETIRSDEELSDCIILDD